MARKPLLKAAAGSLICAFLAVPVQAQHGGHGGGGSAGSTAADKPYVKKLRVREDGSVVLQEPTQIGDRLFKPGRYRFEPVSEGAEHFMVFTSLDLWMEDPPAVGRVACRRESSKKAAKKTEVHLLVHGEHRALQNIQFQGEAVRHVF